MKKISVFYLAISLPLLAIILLYQVIGSVWFSILLIIYAAIYRPIVDGLRLRELNGIEDKDFWKMFIPFWEARFFKKIYLNK